jgi:hypothetical protein
VEGSDGGGKRLRVVDDEPAMHACYRSSLAAVGEGAALGAMAADLFGAGPFVCDDPASTMTHCHQGLDAVAEVERALAAGALSQRHSLTYECRRGSTVAKPPAVSARSIRRSTLSAGLADAGDDRCRRHPVSCIRGSQQQGYDLHPAYDYPVGVNHARS